MLWASGGTPSSGSSKSVVNHPSRGANVYSSSLPATPLSAYRAWLGVQPARCSRSRSSGVPRVLALEPHWTTLQPSESPHYSNGTLMRLLVVVCHVCLINLILFLTHFIESSCWVNYLFVNIFIDSLVLDVYDEVQLKSIVQIINIKAHLRFRQYTSR